MARVKVTTRFQILEFIDRFIDGATATAIGEAVTEEAKRMISEGVSPVRGEGRFSKYSESYTKAIKRKAFPGKKVRPVNLNLTGEMLEGFGFRQKNATTLEIGIIKGSAERKEIASYHQKGTGKMPRRPLVPGEGEEWAVSIMRVIRDLYGSRLSQLIKRSNSKS